MKRIEALIQANKGGTEARFTGAGGSSREDYLMHLVKMDGEKLSLNNIYIAEIEKYVKNIRVSKYFFHRLIIESISRRIFPIDVINIQ